MRFTSIFLCAATIIAACGGDTLVASTPDGGGDGSTDNDASGGKDGSANDSGGGQDAGGQDAGGACMPPNQPCNNPCPKGTVCLSKTGPNTTTQLGCTPLPPACNGTATCDCMASCFCQGSGAKCFNDPTTNGLMCNTGMISRREFKKDIGYVSTTERDELADETLSIPLATYRYKTEGPDQKKHLGFIIDDQPEGSPAVQQDRTHVDEYGYTSMLLATVQRQQAEIDALNARLAALEKSKR